MADDNPNDTDENDSMLALSDGDAPVATRHSYDIISAVDCPYCDRVEEFESRLAARVWEREHILREHLGELPSFTNDEP